MSKTPNFLFIMTDQQRADWLGCYGHPIVRTPNIDALAGQGTLCSNFHVAAPVCMPNRASFLTGRMPTLHGLRYNGCQLSSTANTFVDVLSAFGYDTAAIGKSHVQEFTTANSWHADHIDDDGRPIREAWKTEYVNSAEHPGNYAGSDPYEIDTPYFGFQHVQMSTRHGADCGGHYEQWFRDQRLDWKELRDRSNQLPHEYSCPQAIRTKVPEALYPTTWVADQAVDYIARRTNEDAPFFAYVSFPDPHHPFNPPGKYWDMYDPADFEVALPYSAHQNPIPPMQWLEAARGSNQMTQQTAIYVEDQHVREAMALTAGMITMIDDQVGRLIQALKDAGQYENTVIVFNSDHGDYLGDFNLILKGLLPLRSVTRVPMIWSDPANRSGRVFDGMASTIDLSATILERVGVRPYYGMQGKSMLTSLQSGAPHRDEVLIEFNDGAPKFGFEEPARVRSLVSQNWRLSLYADQNWGELYDLNADPFETQNLWDDPQHAATRASLTERLAHHLIHQMDESPRAHLVA